jgi:type VI protein secretion system component VasF
MDDHFPILIGTPTQHGRVLRWSTHAHRALHAASHDVTRRARRAWQERHDETGLDEAVTKMVWLAVGIAVAVAATTFFVGVFRDAQDNVPDPTTVLP